MSEGKSEKYRIDTWLVENGYFTTRQKAQAALMAGEILDSDTVITKPGLKLSDFSNIRLKSKQSSPYVSRGAFKLLKAFETYHLDVSGKTALDIGSSTGGFTQVFLEKGAEKVFALDSGTNQLAWSLRNHPKVSVFEKTNARYFDFTTLQPVPVFISMDVSFISVTLIIPVLKPLFSNPDFHSLIVLIKPQFELSKEKIGDKGLVSPSYHQEAIQRILDCGDQNGLICDLPVIPSPVTGLKSGNQEFLCRFHT